MEKEEKWSNLENSPAEIDREFWASNCPIECLSKASYEKGLNDSSCLVRAALIGRSEFPITEKVFKDLVCWHEHELSAFLSREDVCLSEKQVDLLIQSDQRFSFPLIVRFAESLTPKLTQWVFSSTYNDHAVLSALVNHKDFKSFIPNEKEEEELAGFFWREGMSKQCFSELSESWRLARERAQLKKEFQNEAPTNKRRSL